MAYVPDLDTLLQRYLDAWNTDDADRRWHLVHGLAAPSLVYLDPYSEKPIEGQAALASYLSLFHEQAGHRLEVTAAPDMHHGWVRVPWRLVTASGEEYVRGLLVGALDREMRFTQIIHFLDA